MKIHAHCCNSLSINDEAGNSVISNRRRRDWICVERPLYCFPRDECCILLYSGQRLNVSDDLMEFLQEKVDGCFSQMDDNSNFILLNFKISYVDMTFWNVKQYWFLDSNLYWSQIYLIRIVKIDELCWTTSLVSKILWTTTHEHIPSISWSLTHINRFHSLLKKKLKILKFVIDLKCESELLHARCSVQVIKMYGLCRPNLEHVSTQTSVVPFTDVRVCFRKHRQDSRILSNSSSSLSVLWEARVTKPCASCGKFFVKDR